MNAPSPAVLMISYGCQMNKLDSELAMGALRSAGYVEAASPETADVILVNTCSVRQHAEEKVFSNVGALKALKAQRPHLLIGILGCMAQKEQARIFKRLPHVDLVVGTSDFPNIVSLLDQARAGRVVACGSEEEVRADRDVATRTSRFQAYVGIMRGCDNYCSYCVVPYVRGREVSRPPAEIVEECRKLAGDGVVEITLLGQNVNSYGYSFDKPGALADLLAELDKIAGLRRVRFVTSHPKDMSREILEAVADLPTVCEHMHMPAQSGSDRMLAAMNRKYTAQHYRATLALCSELVPGIAIASDFIVGFPGETEEDYQATAALIREAQFHNIFVFKYSPRPGTAAAKLADDVPATVKAERNLALLDMQSKINSDRHTGLIGRELEVLAEGASKRNPRRLSGRTRTNEIVVFEGDESSFAGKLVTVRVESATPLTLTGVPVHRRDAEDAENGKA